MKTRAAVLLAPQAAVQVRELELPEPGPGEVLLGMEACGVCHSDLFVGSLEKLPQIPLILGHEGIGRVVATGERVGVTFLGGTCGTCESCRAGRRQYCSAQKNCGYSIHGAMSEYAVVPAQHLARIPERLTAEIAAPLCCAGWTAYGAVREAAVAKGESVALFGMGGLGHLGVRYAARLGAKVIAVDTTEAKFSLARDAGATATVLAATAGREIQKQHGGADAAIVFTGAPAAIQQAFRSLKRNGRVILVGLSTSTYELPLVDSVLKGITIQGSYLGTADDLAEVFRLAVEENIVPAVEPFPLESAPDILQRMKAGELLGRAVIRF